jgi:hypothetical protein
VPVVAREALEAMSTPALLGRLERLRRCEDDPSQSDCEPTEVPAGLIVFKSDAAWQRAHAELKEVLATRGHVPGGAERIEARRARTERNRTKERPPRLR